MAPPIRRPELPLFLQRRHTDDIPCYKTWNELFETHEFVRLANCVVWACKAAKKGQEEWTFEELAKIGGWFEAWRPVLPIDDEREQREKILHY